MNRFVLAAALLASSFAASANATVITFDAAKGQNGNGGYVSGAYQEQGYSVAASLCSTQNTCFYAAPLSSTSLDKTGAALTNFVEQAVMTVTKIGGGAFSLNSLTLADIYGNFYGFSPQTETVAFTFNFVDGTSSSSNYTLANTPGQWVTPNTLSFNVAPLLSFSFKPTTNTNGFIQFDNLTVSAVQAVPEPATWAMFIGGFGMIGAALRRRPVLTRRFA